jgi:hypothetical protein
MAGETGSFPHQKDALIFCPVRWAMHFFQKRWQILNRSTLSCPIFVILSEVRTLPEYAQLLRDALELLVAKAVGVLMPPGTGPAIHAPKKLLTDPW